MDITVLAWPTNEWTTSTILGKMTLADHGVGIRMSSSALHELAGSPDVTVQVTCLVSLAVPLRGTVELKLTSTVLNNKSRPDSQDARESIEYAFCL